MTLVSNKKMNIFPYHTLKSLFLVHTMKTALSCNPPLCRFISWKISAGKCRKHSDLHLTSCWLFMLSRSNILMKESKPGQKQTKHFLGPKHLRPVICLYQTKAIQININSTTVSEKTSLAGTTANYFHGRDERKQEYITAVIVTFPHLKELRACIFCVSTCTQSTLKRRVIYNQFMTNTPIFCSLKTLTYKW